MRMDSNHLRRVFQRKQKRKRPLQCQAEHDASKYAKIKLVNVIKRAKKQAWAELCDLVDKDLWEKP